MTDREILEWVAQARRGDYVPFDQERLRLILRDAGYPRAALYDTVVVEHITPWVRDWLKRHPKA